MLILLAVVSARLNKALHYEKVFLDVFHNEADYQEFLLRRGLIKESIKYWGQYEASN